MCITYIQDVLSFPTIHQPPVNKMHYIKKPELRLYTNVIHESPEVYIQ